MLDLSQNQLTSASMVSLVPLIPAVGPGHLVGPRSASPQQLQELHLAGNTGELSELCNRTMCMSSVVIGAWCTAQCWRIHAPVGVTSRSNGMPWLSPLQPATCAGSADMGRPLQALVMQAWQPSAGCWQDASPCVSWISAAVV